MRRIRIWTASLVGIAVALLTSGGTTAQADDLRLWPINGPVTRGFDLPDTKYDAGHRGIDIGAPAGVTIVASADGVVTFVGSINYVPMVTVTHPGGVRTTYQPVTATVRQGETVRAGHIIGTLGAGHAASPCLHFGVLQGDTYLDPLVWLSARRAIRLLPPGTLVPPRPPAAFVGTAGGWPVAGPVTSGYGYRIHPILGTRLFHDGIDIGAACGTPVATPWAGVVTAVSSNATMGNYVSVSHAGGLVTSYLHLSGFSVSLGDQVAAGQQIGLVGTTGLSTGCHLHFSARSNGSSIDPATLLH